MDPNNMTDEEKKVAMMRAAKQCNFLCLFLCCAAAFGCGLTATGYCSFVLRNIELSEDSTTACAELGIPEDQCLPMTENHGVGFFGWQATVPVDQLVCFSYTEYIDGKFREPVPCCF
jgi:hypothetical protein